MPAFLASPSLPTRATSHPKPRLSSTVSGSSTGGAACASRQLLDLFSATTKLFELRLFSLDPMLQTRLHGAVRSDKPLKAQSPGTMTRGSIGSGLDEFHLGNDLCTCAGHKRLAVTGHQPGIWKNRYPEYSRRQQQQQRSLHMPCAVTHFFKPQATEGSYNLNGSTVPSLTLPRNGV